MTAIWFLLGFHAVSIVFLQFVIWGNIYRRRRFEPIFEVDCKRSYLYQRDGALLCVLYSLETIVLGSVLFCLWLWAWNRRRKGRRS